MSMALRIIIGIACVIALYFLVTTLARNVAEESGSTIAPASSLAASGPAPIG